MYKIIKRLLLLFVLLGLISTGIDYTRLISGELPVFNIKSYNPKSHIQTFRGLFYRAERTVKANVAEKLVDSKNIRFKILTFDINVPKQFKEQTFEFTLETKKEKTCTESKLLYADRAIKIYTFCLDEINIIDTNTKKKDSLFTYLTKDYSIIDDIDSKLIFQGTENDHTQGANGTILKFKSDNDKFTNEGLVIYRCNKQYVNDVYIAPKGTKIREDFCKYKDDDFYFLYEISEDPFPEGTEVVNTPEPFYEDETYRYEFDTPKKDRIFITTPGVRGRAPKKIPLKQVLDEKTLTIEQLIDKGLKCNKIDKAKELAEKLKKEEEEKKRLEEEKKRQEEETKKEEKESNN